MPQASHDSIACTWCVMIWPQVQHHMVFPGYENVKETKGFLYLGLAPRHGPACILGGTPPNGTGLYFGMALQMRSEMFRCKLIRV